MAHAVIPKGQSGLDWWMPLRMLVRFPLLILHILLGIPLTIVTFNRLGRSIRVAQQSLDEAMLRWWSRTLCRLFGLQLSVTGKLAPAPDLVVANHVSWLDIPLLHALGHMSFVAKSEIRKWPLVGWLATLAETVYHKRGCSDSLQGTAEEITGRLREGVRVAIFPEGRVFPGDTVHRFHARLFRAAMDAPCPVQPVCIRYTRNGAINKDISFRFGESFLSNFFRLLASQSCHAEVSILPTLSPVASERRVLADAAQQQVLNCYGNKHG